MTIMEMSKKIGTIEKRCFNGLWVSVEIKDIKVSYGQERYLVSVAGQQDSNAVWVNA